MSDFEPVFFNPIKPPDNDYVTSNCMTAYSIAINSDFPVLRHDLYFVKNLLKENPNFHKMELLSLLYDFMYIIRIPLSNNSCFVKYSNLVFLSKIIVPFEKETT